MKSANDSLNEIVNDYKKMQVLETKESSLSSNKGWVSAQSNKTGKRGPSSHIPSEGRHPESVRSLTQRTLDGVSKVIKQRRMMAEDKVQGVPTRRTHAEWEMRRKAALAEVDVSAVEVAFLYGYTDAKSVRELRIRHGRDEHSGRALQDSQRPIISTTKRVRK